jgi:hypothetical protein
MGNAQINAIANAPNPKPSIIVNTSLRIFCDQITTRV